MNEDFTTQRMIFDMFVGPRYADGEYVLLTLKRTDLTTFHELKVEFMADKAKATILRDALNEHLEYMT